MNGRRSLFAAACLSVAGDAWAFATCDPGAPTVVSIAPIEVPADPQMGEVLGDPNGYPFEVPDAMRCTYDPNVVIDYWSYMTFSHDRLFIGYWLNAQGWRMPVYQSGVTGVGVGMVAQDRDGGAYVGVGGQATAIGENRFDLNVGNQIPHPVHHVVLGQHLAGFIHDIFNRLTVPRAFQSGHGDNRNSLGVVQLQAASLSFERHVRQGVNHQFVDFSRGELHKPSYLQCCEH